MWGIAVDREEINIRLLKRFALELPPGYSILRDCILEEPDMLNRRELLGKIPIYLRLLEDGPKKDNIHEILSPARMFESPTANGINRRLKLDP